VAVPTFDEDIPRLAEIARTLSDFRMEFRNFSTEVVRKDVYGAHMASIQLQMDALGRDNKRLSDELDKEREERQKDRHDRETDRRSFRNVGVGAALSAVVAIIVMIMGLLVK
jgi:hypothetical protein